MLDGSSFDSQQRKDIRKPRLTSTAFSAKSSLPTNLVPVAACTRVE